MIEILVALVLIQAVLLAIVIWCWRQATVRAQDGERALQHDLAAAQVRGALGDEARRALEAAQTAHAEAQARSAAAEARSAASIAEVDGLRSALAGMSARLVEQERLVERLRSELGAATAEAQRLRGELAQGEALAVERQRAVEESRALLATQLRALTQQLYEEQGRAMLGEGRQQLEQAISPFRQRLNELQARIDQVHATDLQDRASLHTELKSMLAAQVRLGDEAEQLGRALRADTKAQGSWGELTLQRLLEASQLERGLTYDLQVSVRSDEGDVGRPDAVIFLPDQKALAIDAKVSLTSFLRATNATNEDERSQALRDHLNSVRNHMRSLAGREYPEAIQASLKGHALDLTLLFLPSEAAFAAAVVQDGELWADAMKQRIIIVSPTTLLATLRVVAQIWRVEKQNRNAATIAKEAGGILEKLRGTLDDFDAVGRALQGAQKAYEDARGKLSTGKGSLMRRAGKLIALGAPIKDETRARIVQDSDDEDESPT